MSCSLDRTPLRSAALGPTSIRRVVKSKNGSCVLCIYDFIALERENAPASLLHAMFENKQRRLPTSHYHCVSHLHLDGTAGRNSVVVKWRICNCDPRKLLSRRVYSIRNTSFVTIINCNNNLSDMHKAIHDVLSLPLFHLICSVTECGRMWACISCMTWSLWWWW